MLRNLPSAKGAFKIAFAIPVAIVGAVALLFWLFGWTDLTGHRQPQAKPAADYYVMLALVEAAAQKPDGSAWDFDGSAPDLYYEIYWRGVRVFKSSTKEDSLLAKWSNAEIDLRELAISGRKISSDEAIKGARIAAREGESIAIKIFDSDTLSRDDLVGELKIKTTDLVPGEQTFQGDGKGWVRVVLRVLDMAKPPDLLK